MRKAIRIALIVLLVLLMIATFYMIFGGVGNPNSPLRYIIEDTSYDLLVTMLMALSVGVIVIILTRQSSSHPLEYMLDQNRSQVEELRAAGKSDDYIADDFLQHLGVKNRLIYWLARRRVRRHLKRMK
jgi:hypothetical protein